MCLLLETIKIEDGKILNLEYHNRRYNSSLKNKFGISGDKDLGLHISMPADLGPGVFRCRILYTKNIEKIEFVPHEERIVRSLKLVTADGIDYSLKYADRKELEALFEKRDECDEILIVKNGYITDTSVSNIVFRRHDGTWVTPDAPLLGGTMRMFLLETGRISEAGIRSSDLPSFSAAKMINCMTDLEKGPIIEMENIKS